MFVVLSFLIVISKSIYQFLILLFISLLISATNQIQQPAKSSKSALLIIISAENTSNVNDWREKLINELTGNANLLAIGDNSDCPGSDSDPSEDNLAAPILEKVVNCKKKLNLHRKTKVVSNGCSNRKSNFRTSPMMRKTTSKMKNKSNISFELRKVKTSIIESKSMFKQSNSSTTIFIDAATQTENET